jgi:UDP-N-acetylmuramoylalanine--D-glutamate ligase
LVFFSGGAEVEAGAFKTNGELTLRMASVDREICKASEVKLLGHHNLLNVLAASALAGLADVPLEAIRNVATTFSGVEHRLELVRNVNDARWYNDSIATAPERSLAAMRSFEDPIVLLAGGRDKDLPWDGFVEEALRRVRQLITFGEVGPMIAKMVEEARRSGRETRLRDVKPVGTLDEAVEEAARVARSGDVVLLSPGGTSFDAFRDFAERGDRFKNLVQAL